MGNYDFDTLYQGVSQIFGLWPPPNLTQKFCRANCKKWFDELIK